MTTLTPAQVYLYARGAGLNPASATIAVAIAGAESGFRTDAMGDVGIQTATWGPSVGLWQIRSLKAEYGKGTSRDASRLTDPVFNAKAMVAISGEGKNWKPWSTWTNGAYKKYVGSDGDLGKAIGGDNGKNLDPSLFEAAGQALSDPVGTVKDAASAINPFGDWAEQGLGLGLKLLATTVAGALVVVGALRTVSARG